MNWNTAENKQLVEALLLLQTPAEARKFLRDLMTEGEILDFGRRLQTAKMLSEGVPYPLIQSATGFSSTTVARVSKWLQEGEGGYDLVLNKLNHVHHRTNSLERGLR